MLDVTINGALDALTQSQMRGEVISAASSKLGVELSETFDHVLIVIEKCYRSGGESCSWAAYAYVNHWLSVYQQQNYKFPGGEMHLYAAFIPFRSCS